MKEIIKNIEAGIGLGKLKFGMTQKDVKRIIGLPNEIEIYEYLPETKERNEHWHYTEFELSIYFSSEDNWRLDSMSIHADFYDLWCSIQIGHKLEQVVEKLSSLEIKNYLCEDMSTLESPDHILYDLGDSGINLWFDHRELSTIQWGPKFKDEDTIIWPYTSKFINSKAEIGCKRYSTDFLFSKLGAYLDEWLNKIFSEGENYSDLINEFPTATQRENLNIENRSVRYFLNVKEHVDGSILAKARLLHNEHGDIGWMAVEWTNDLTVLDDYLQID